MLCVFVISTETEDEQLSWYIQEQTQRKNHIDTFTDEQLQVILSATVVLLRCHSNDNRLCCNNNEDNLKVTDIDTFGFVTRVTCKECRQHMDTTCYNEWTKERIYDKSQLKVGDHICWHRWYAIWHHAIVRSYPSLQVIHYDRGLKVVELDFSEATKCLESCSCCDALYRIN